LATNDSEGKIPKLFAASTSADMETETVFYLPHMEYLGNIGSESKVPLDFKSQNFY
jgi:hypothetical protein